jgi:geranylgeranyl diphosphate synthase type I
VTAIGHGIAPLDRWRGVVNDGLAAALDRLHPDLARSAAYHFGWADAHGRRTDGSGGKGVRPALVMLAAEGSGGDPLVAVPAAVAVELVHAFSLVHDDVMDGDHERHHRPSVWALYGVPHAVIAGDGLLTLALQVLMDEPGAGPAATARLLTATAEMIRGQTDDLAFEGQGQVSLADSLAMEGRKTGALLGAAAALGAEMVGAPAVTVAALDRFGFELGQAFQAVDDLLGIWGDPARTGKPTASDLRRAKRTLPVVAALAGEDPAAQELGHLLSGGGHETELNGPELERATLLIEQCGGRQATEALARVHLRAALDSLAQAGLSSGPTEDLVGLAHFVVERQG